MNNERIPTELREDFEVGPPQLSDEDVEQLLDEVRQEADAFDTGAVAIASRALKELVSKDSLQIYCRNDKWGTVDVNRIKHDRGHYVTKAYTGVLSAQTKRETASLLNIKEENLQWTIRMGGVSFDDQELDERREIRLPYVGLDLLKWESLLRRNETHNPFLHVDFYLNLALASLRALGEFHKCEENSFVHCDVKLSNFCVEATDIRLVDSPRSGKTHVAGTIDLGKFVLIDLGSAFTVTSTARKLPENTTGIGPKWLVVADSFYIAPSYSNATALAVSTGDLTFLEQVTWKADLFSLGAMFQTLLQRYQSHLNSSEAGYEYLIGLPERLKRYEFDHAWSVQQLPHQELIKQINELPGVKPSLKQKFEIPVLEKEIEEVSRLTGIADDQSDISRGSYKVNPAPNKLPKTLVLASLAFFSVAVLAAWLVAKQLAPPGQNPSPASVITRSDPLFKRCDALREKSMASNQPLLKSEYATAARDCGLLLASAGVGDDLKFDALMIRSVAHEKTDKFQAALEDLKAAEAIQPGSYGVDLDRALILFRQGHEQWAFEALHSAIRKGWRDRDLIEKDLDFKGLVANPKYQSVRTELTSLK